MRDDNKRDETPRQRISEGCEYFIEVEEARLDVKDKSAWSL